eukprot:m.187450 g.187450  ORF g.187450 m.187450 type:complete len:330 (-) comp32306_c3_seq1:277-1266(-)
MGAFYQSIALAGVCTILSSVSGAEFKLIPQGMRYVQAKIACSQLGVGWQIASVHSDEEFKTTMAICNSDGAAKGRVCYLGAYSDGRGDWRWEDGSLWDYVPDRDSSDGLNGIGETKIAINTNDEKWHDWSNGVATLASICRKEPTLKPTPAPATSQPTSPPTTSTPTPMPTRAPSYWFDHKDFGENITALHLQVNGLAQDNGASKTLHSEMLQRIADLEQKQIDSEMRLQRFEATQQKIDARLNQTRDAIKAAVATFTTGQALFNPVYNDEGCVADCGPTVEANGFDMMIRSPAGAVRMYSSQCGEMDPCKMTVSMQAVTDAMNELKLD